MRAAVAWAFAGAGAFLLGLKGPLLGGGGRQVAGVARAPRAGMGAGVRGSAGPAARRARARGLSPTQ